MSALPEFDDPESHPEDFWYMNRSTKLAMRGNFGYVDRTGNVPHRYRVYYTWEEQHQIEIRSGIYDRGSVSYYSNALFDWNAQNRWAVPKNSENYFMSVYGWDWKLKPFLTVDWFKYCNEPLPLRSGRDPPRVIFNHVGFGRFRYVFRSAEPKIKVRILLGLGPQIFDGLYGVDSLVEIYELLNSKYKNEENKGMIKYIGNYLDETYGDKKYNFHDGADHGSSSKGEGPPPPPP